MPLHIADVQYILINIVHYMCHCYCTTFQCNCFFFYIRYTCRIYGVWYTGIIISFSMVYMVYYIWAYIYGYIRGYIETPWYICAYPYTWYVVYIIRGI